MPAEEDLGGDTPTQGLTLEIEACDDNVGEVGEVLEIGEVEGVVDDDDESLCNAEAVRPFFQ